MGQDHDDDCVVPDEPRPKGLTAWALFLIHVVILLGVPLLLVAKFPVDYDPGRTADRNATLSRCQTALPHDDLVHLALRTSDRARIQVHRWEVCTKGEVTERARRALWWDFLVIGLIAFGLGMAIIRTARRSRWRWSAILAVPFALLYVFADVAENFLLFHFLDHPDDWHSVVRWAASVKFGALIGASFIFLVSLVIAIGDLGNRADDDLPLPTPLPPPPAPKHPATDPDDPSAVAPRPSPRLGARLERLVSGNTEWVTAPAAMPEPLETDVRPTQAWSRVAVACSGGGIRSAAFNLGALQALDVAQPQSDVVPEIARVRWISAVSGGSYIASAWVSARADGNLDSKGRRRWSRRSDEEDHLRRHASYIAPGFAGKFWAAMRIVLGLALNVFLVVAVVAAVALPYGWLVGAAQEDVPASGGGAIVVKSDGAALRLLSGRKFLVLENQSVRLANGETARLLRRAPVVSEPDSQGEKPKASVKITDTDGRTTESSVVGEGSTNVTQDVGDGAVADATVSIDTTEPEADAEPAATQGRKLVSGTKVSLSPRRPIDVHGRVLGCFAVTENGEHVSECAPGRLRYLTVGEGTELVLRGNSNAAEPAQAVLTLKGDAVVDGRRLVKACGSHQCEHVSIPTLSTLVWVVLGVAVVLGMISVAVRPRDRLRARSERAFRVVAMIGLGLLLVVFVFPALVSWAEGQRWGLEERSRLAGVSVFTVILALIAQVVPLLGSGSDPKDPGKVVTAVKKLGTRLKPVLIRIAVYLAVPLLILAIALFFASLGAQREAGPPELTLWLAVTGALLIVAAGADLNQWSLHPYYRERLMGAFGVQPRDPDLALREPAWLDALPTKPELIVCAATNVSDGRVTAPGRSVVPWVFSHTAVGAPALQRVFGTAATVPPQQLQGKLGYLRSLWTSVAVSGAAFSPSMGKMTRPERALMALGNIRLGVWYPNPAMLGRHERWYQRHHPTPVYLVKEAFGIHRATDRYVYVTDGGHYENLGLVELLRRPECRAIYCFDASGDAIDTFGTMAEAMRLAREELGVEIEFDPAHLKADEKGISKLGAWAATVYDTDSTGVRRATGWIVFGKLEVPKDAPFDVVDLARTLPSFPNNPTMDQLYTDQKFEAYRALGFYLGEHAAKLGQDIRRRLRNGETIEDAVTAANGAIAPKAEPEETHVVLKVSPDP